MGSEVSTVGGAVFVLGTSIAAGVCFGQVKCLNDAVVETSIYTGRKFMETNVRHVGETLGMAVAAGVTLGQIKEVNDHLKCTATKAGKTLKETVSDVADIIPVVGHIKGGFHYACGDIEGGNKAMKYASRTTGVIGGGIAGIPLGPAGMVAGGMAGGAAMDGIITGVDSAVNKEFKPCGQIAAWNQALTAIDAQGRVEGIIGLVMAPVLDGLGGYAAGKFVQRGIINAEQAKLKTQVKYFLEEGGNLDLMEAIDAAGKMEPAGKCIPTKVPEKNHPKDVLYDGKEIPEEAYRKNGDTVYRGDKRLLDSNYREQAFNEGVKPKGPYNDAYTHTCQNNAGTNFSSTTTSFEMAKEFGVGKNGNAIMKVHVIDGVDIPLAGKLTGKLVKFPGQLEVAINGGIPANLIEGVLEIPKLNSSPKIWHPNPNFQPPVAVNQNIIYFVEQSGMNQIIKAIPYILTQTKNI